MISEQGLAALRIAAALCHGMPRVRARIRAGDTVLLHVLNPANDEQLPTDGRVLSPCAFRCSVAQAYQRIQAGQQLSFLHLPVGVDPAIDIATPSSGTARTGGIYRVPLEGRWLWGFATTLHADVAFDLGADVVAAAELSSVVALGIRPDLALGVSLAYAETIAAPDTAEERDLVDLLEALLARWTAHELVESLIGDAPVRGNDS